MKGFDKIRDMNLAELERINQSSDEQDTQDMEEALDEKAEQENAEAEMTESEATESEAAAGESSPKELPEGIKTEEREPMGQFYKVDSDMTAGFMREFLFGHYYREPMIIIMTILGIGLFGYSAVMRPANMYTYMVASIILVLGYPLSFLTKSKSIVKKNPVFQQTFHYMFDESGVLLKVGEEVLDLPWKYVIRVRRLKNIAVVYTGKANGYLIPYEDLGSQKDEILTFIESNVRKAKVEK